MSEETETIFLPSWSPETEELINFMEIPNCGAVTGRLPRGDGPAAEVARRKEVAEADGSKCCKRSSTDTVIEESRTTSEGWRQRVVQEFLNKLTLDLES